MLYDARLRKHAFTIISLEFFLPKTAQNARYLELLYHPYAQDYAEDILKLEFKPERSVDEQLLLEELYLRVCCKLPKPTARDKILKEMLAKDGVVEGAQVPSGCGASIRRGGNMAGFFYDKLGIVDESGYRQQIEAMKTAIKRAVVPVINAQFEVQRVTVAQRLLPGIKDYAEQKTELLYQAVLKYFSTGADVYTQVACNQLVSKIIQKIYDRDLTLNQADRLMSLAEWLPQSCEQQQKMAV